MCLKTTVPPKQPMLASTLPSYPWEKVASDLFELNKEKFLLVVEVQKLNNTTASNVVTTLKSIFARHGIPATLVSDNGPPVCMQRNERVFRISSSPHYPQSNGQAERAVKTVKQLFEHSTD